MNSMTQRFDRHYLALIGIIAVGLVLRIYGLDWDQGLYLHPDERFIAIVSSERIDAPKLDNLGSIFDPANSSLNPRRDGLDGRPLSFAYGTLPLYVQSVVSWAANLVAERDFQSYRYIYQIGRPLTVIMDILTMAFVYLLARRLFGVPAALVATSLYALTVLAIQLSHFFTVDVWLTAFVTAGLYLAVRYTDSPSLARALALSVPVGCAFATKASVPSFIIPLLVAAICTIWRSGDRRITFVHLAIAGISALAIFTLFEPYALARPAPFIEDIGAQARIVRGHFDVPFTRQFVGLTPGLYELNNLIRYTMGPGFVLAGLAGLVFGARRLVQQRSLAVAIPLTWILAYLPTILVTEAKFLRYALPLIPVTAVFAGGFLVHGLARYPRVIRQAATALVLIVTATWAVGFTTIYAAEHPRIAASKWIHANIPPGTAVSVESWDDALPLPYSGAPPAGYLHISFDMYGDQPPEDKVAALADSLHSVDYVILSSNRIIDSVDNLPWRYAVQNEYYRRLLAGQLGFRLVYEADLRPSLFGYRYDDSNSDESFTVYDHPHVRIFQKVEQLSAAEIRERLLWGIEQPWIPQRYPLEQTLLLDRPFSEIPTTRDASWNQLAVDKGLVAILSWLLVIEVIGLATLPFAALLLRRTPDRGAFSARLLGLVMLGWVGWIAASLGIWSSRSVNHLVALVILAGLSWGLYQRSGRRWAMPSPRAYLASTGVWFSVFGFFLLLRALYPDFWQTWYGGEKPFELAYLRAIAQSTTFPPYDPWYAGGTINYYYYGWHLIATVVKLSGVGVSHGFQLASASFAAFLALQAATLGATLVSRGRSYLPLRYPTIAACVSVIALLFAGNLDAIHQVVRLRSLSSDRFDFWQSTRVVSFTINEFPYFSQLWADVHPHVINFPILALLMTLLIHVMMSPRFEIRADMLPTLCTVALVLGSVGVTNSWDAPLAIGLTIVAFAYAGLLHSIRRGIAGTAIGIIVVATSFVLFWPFYAGFYSVVEGLNRTSEGSALGEFLVVWGIFYGVVFVVMAVDALLHRYDSSAIRDAIAFAVLAFLSGGLSLVISVLKDGAVPSPERVLALLVATTVIGIATLATRPVRLHPALVLAISLVTVISMAGTTYRPAATVALAIAVSAAMYALSFRRQPPRFIPWACIALGSVILAGTEVVYVVDDLQRSPWERMNTVFKFYLQAWILLAVACAVLLTRLWVTSRVQFIDDIRNRPATFGIVADPTSSIGQAPGTVRQPLRRIFARTGAVFGTLLLSLGLAYPLAGTPVRLAQDMPSSPTELTLDGYAWMDGGYILNGTHDVIDFTGDLAAIDWLNRNVQGTPVILEAAIGPYRGNGGRISSATGLPAVLGWDRHQRQQRFEPGISKRMADVRLIYNETDPARKMEMLRRYRVEYVVVGDIERRWNTDENPSFYAAEAGLAAFDALLGNGLTLVFEFANTRIYRVDDFPRIPPADGAVHRL